MNNNNPENPEEGTFETIKKYGIMGFEKAKELTSQGIAKVQDPEFQNEVRQKANSAWETTKCGALVAKEKVAEVN